MTVSFTHRLQKRSNHFPSNHWSVISYPAKSLVQGFLKKKEMLGFFHLCSATKFTRKLTLFVLILQMARQVSPAGTPNCDRQFCSCSIMCGPKSLKWEESELTSPAPRAQHPPTTRVSPSTALVRAGKQEVHYQLLLSHIESHRFVIQYTAFLCAAHTANPCTIFLSVFPPPPTVLLTSLHTGETEQLRKQPSRGKFLKVSWAHPTWGEHSKKNRKGRVGAPSAPYQNIGILPSTSAATYIHTICVMWRYQNNRIMILILKGANGKNLANVNKENTLESAPP